MTGLDGLYAFIPTQELASKLGVDEGEVDSACRTLVPELVARLHQNPQDPEHAGASESAARGLLDTGAKADESDGLQAVATVLGGNNTDQIVWALVGKGAGNGDLLKQLLPVLIPIVLSYIGKQQQKEVAASGGLSGKILGGILGGKK